LAYLPYARNKRRFRAYDYGKRIAPAECEQNVAANTGGFTCDPSFFV